MKFPPLLLVSGILATACEPRNTPVETLPETPATPTTPTVGSNGIVGDWWATDVTVNGVRDPERNPTHLVRWHIEADSSFSMWDATEGAPDSMNGRWGLTADGRTFRMLDERNKEITTFGIVALKNDSLKLKVLEETQVEVLLQFVRH